MFAVDVLKDRAFPDPSRPRLQQTHDNTADSESAGFAPAIAGLCIVGILILFLASCGCFNVYRGFCASTSRATAMSVPDLHHHQYDANLRKIRMSTLSERKEATMKLFKTTLVTMKVTEDDIYEELGCIDEDIESGFGILKLSRPVARSSNLTPEDESSSPLPPAEWCDVHNMCAICLDSYEPGQVVAWSSGCRHAFHQDCITQYLAKKMIGGETPCPSCRQKFCDLPEHCGQRRH